MFMETLEFLEKSGNGFSGHGMLSVCYGKNSMEACFGEYHTHSVHVVPKRQRKIVPTVVFHTTSSMCAELRMTCLLSLNKLFY